MADDRPVIKQDLDNLKHHIDAKFEAQSEARARVYQRLEKMAVKDNTHELKLNFIEGRLNRFFAGLTTVSIGLFLALCRLFFEYFKGGV